MHHGRNTPMCSPRASRGIAAPRAVRGRMRGSSASVHLRAVGGHVHVWHQFVSPCHVGLRAPSRHRRGLASTGAGIDVGLLRFFGTIIELVVSYIFHLASYTSYIPVSPHEEVRMTARARHFGPLPMVEVRFPLLNGAFRNDDASGHMCVYVCMFLCLCLCVGV